jgi:hypothetical protein
MAQSAKDIIKDLISKGKAPKSKEGEPITITNRNTGKQVTGMWRTVAGAKVFVTNAGKSLIDPSGATGEGGRKGAKDRQEASKANDQEKASRARRAYDEYKDSKDPKDKKKADDAKNFLDSAKAKKTDNKPTATALGKERAEARGETKKPEGAKAPSKDSFNEALKNSDAVAQAAKRYNKTKDEIVQALQVRIKTAKDKDGNMKSVSIDFTDTVTKIKFKMSDKGSGMKETKSPKPPTSAQRAATAAEREKEAADKKETQWQKEMRVEKELRKENEAKKEKKKPVGKKMAPVKAGDKPVTEEEANPQKFKTPDFKKTELYRGSNSADKAAMTNAHSFSNLSEAKFDDDDKRNLRDSLKEVQKELPDRPMTAEEIKTEYPEKADQAAVKRQQALMKKHGLFSGKDLTVDGWKDMILHGIGDDWVSNWAQDDLNDQIHDMVEKYQEMVDPKQLRMFKAILAKGKDVKKEASDYDKSEVARGTKVEMEHTDSKKEAQKIALDHLAEDPKYYSKLAKIHLEKGDTMEKGRKDGLVPKMVTVTRGGKTFQQKVWVRPDEKKMETHGTKEAGYFEVKFMKDGKEVTRNLDSMQELQEEGDKLARQGIYRMKIKHSNSKGVSKKLNFEYQGGTWNKIDMGKFGMPDYKLKAANEYSKGFERYNALTQKQKKKVQTDHLMTTGNIKWYGVAMAKFETMTDEQYDTFKLTGSFDFDDVEDQHIILTDAMKSLEQQINIQQSYIRHHGDANDANSDEQWEQYKEDAEYNLKKWDQMKAKRDKLGLSSRRELADKAPVGKPDPDTSQKEKVLANKKTMQNFINNAAKAARETDKDGKTRETSFAGGTEVRNTTDKSDYGRILAKYKFNEQYNLSSENHILLAEAFGTESEVALAKEAKAIRDKQGFADSEISSQLQRTVGQYYYKLTEKSKATKAADKKEADKKFNEAKESVNNQLVKEFKAADAKVSAVEAKGGMSLRGYGGVQTTPEYDKALKEAQKLHVKLEKMGVDPFDQKYDKLSKEVSNIGTMSASEKKELKTFEEYVSEFYNDVDGLYPIASKKDVISAVHKYVNSKPLNEIEFDSMDRESVRSIIQSDYKMF